MVKSMFGAIAGLRTHQSQMDVISNNIANVNTWGYKTRSANFQDSMYTNLTNSTGGDTNAGGLGGTNSSQLGYGVKMGSITTNFSGGSGAYTGNSNNCMLDGSGFFIVGNMPTLDENGDPVGVSPNLSGNDPNVGRLSLSRVGIFKVDENGYLTDDNGNYVYGFEPTADVDAFPSGFDTTAIKPIRYPAAADGSGNREKISAISIGTDGTITGIATEGDRKIPIGQLAIASVQNPEGLEQTEGHLYHIGANTGRADAIPTVANTTGKVVSGYLELSNVDLATEMANMITAERGYQANSKIITVTDEMLEQLVNMKR